MPPHWFRIYVHVGVESETPKTGIGVTIHFVYIIIWIIFLIYLFLLVFAFRLAEIIIRSNE